MAKARIPNRSKKLSAALDSVDLLKKCGLALEAEMAGISPRQAPEKPTELKLPSPVWDVLIDIQARLYQLKGIVAGVHALAEANDDSSDARWALEAALPMFDSIIDSADPAMVRRAASEREVSRGS